MRLLLQLITPLFVVLCWHSSPSTAFVRPVRGASTTILHRHQAASAKDTPLELPTFDSEEDYLNYMETVSQLPKGFSVGTAAGTFVSVEAPALGNLPIKGTVIHLTEGPTDNWAAVFTKNKVRSDDQCCVGLPEGREHSERPKRRRFTL